MFHNPHPEAVYNPVLKVDLLYEEQRSKTKILTLPTKNANKTIEDEQVVLGYINYAYEEGINETVIEVYVHPGSPILVGTCGVHVIVLDTVSKM